MKHFDSCRCEKCRERKPAPPAAPCGYLMQQIVSEGHVQERCRQFFLSLSPLPRILVPPYSIRDVRVSGDVTISDDACRDITAAIPLTVIVCDQQGNTHAAAAQLTLNVPMRTSRTDAQQYTASAQVSLCQHGVCFDDPACVPACLSVCLQVFGVRTQAMYTPAPCAPVCPDLPLYPPPCRF